MTVKITPQIVANGSYDIFKNRLSPKGPAAVHTIKVWHVTFNGKPVGVYMTRQEARNVARRLGDVRHI